MPEFQYFNRPGYIFGSPASGAAGVPFLTQQKRQPGANPAEYHKGGGFSAEALAAVRAAGLSQTVVWSPRSRIYPSPAADRAPLTLILEPFGLFIKASF